MVRRVIKFGGSLLARPEPFAELPRWLDRWDGVALIVVGGGAAVDQLRRQNCSDLVAHRLAIEIMSENARRLAAANAMAIVRELPDKLGRRSRHWVLDVAAYLHSNTSCVNDMPASWDVTSDSIAAGIARDWDAHELVLLKSCPPPEHDPERPEACHCARRSSWDFDRAVAARAGYVDAFFPTASEGLRVAMVDACDSRLLPPRK